ncbi:MAG: hypothetical protein JO302_05585 [Candidatus Eremiobacteraeota bacterium]|nr:hypothetical protein [Candidatus Eremiobacteraeota bacterium]
MSATGDAGSDAATVTCQASLGELRSAAFWLYTHDRASQRVILLVIAGAIVIFTWFDQIVGHWSAFTQYLIEHPSWGNGRGVGATIWVAAFVTYRAWLLWTLPARAWRRMQMEGPVTLTVSATGLSWHNSVRRKEAGWDQYCGYAELPAALIFVSTQPFIVPRSTVSSIDFERVLAIAKRYLQPVKQFDSQKGRTSPDRQFAKS